jgi:hypothetical protein
MPGAGIARLASGAAWQEIGVHHSNEMKKTIIG